MKLFYSPGACSLGIHVLLEEIGKPYEVAALSFKDGEQYQPDFVAINPKSKVPALLRDDGTVLTEYGAIATWLARANPDANLLPTDPNGEARVLEALDYAVGTVHGQGYSRLFKPANFAPSESDHEAVKAQGRKLVENGFALLNRALGGQDYIAGEFSIADTALLYVERWAKRVEIELPSGCAAHLARMLARPAVSRVMKAEGLG